MKFLYFHKKKYCWLDNKIKEWVDIFDERSIIDNTSINYKSLIIGFTRNVSQNGRVKKNINGLLNDTVSSIHKNDNLSFSLNESLHSNIKCYQTLVNSINSSNRSLGYKLYMNGFLFINRQY